MTTTGGAVPLNLDRSECAVPSDTGVCLSESDKAYQHVRNFLKNNGHEIVAKMRPADMIAELKKILSVTSESQIWENRIFRKYIGENICREVLENKYKPQGPANSTALLDNNNIDKTLEQWSNNSEKMFGKKFYHIPYQMIDFMEVQSELSCLDLNDLISKGYDCFGVILNTDISSGGGKHWFCLYGDFSGKGTRSDPYILEYFNSSGNAPMDQVTIWMEEACHKLLKYHKKYCETVRSASRQLQNSQTECGMWSLLYIRSRLENHPYNWFYIVEANDVDMIECRKSLFREH
jgi:hypothetical protein